MSNAAQKQAEMISPDAYPQMMSKQDAAYAMRTLRSGQTMVKAQVAMEAAVPPMKIAPKQAKSSRQTSEGAPICAIARVT